MPDAPDHSPAAHQDEILLLAEKLGEALDRLNKIESEFTAQTAPLDAAGASISAANTALHAALKGIEQLNFHVLDNNLGAVSKRLESHEKLTAAEHRALAEKTDQIRIALADATKYIATRFEKLETQRNEFTQAQASEVDRVRAEFSAGQKNIAGIVETLTAQLADTRREFAEPKSLNPMGKWDAQHPGGYDRLDVVSLNGTSYISKIDGNTEKPSKTSTAWTVLSSRGGSVLGGGGATDITGVAGMGATGLQIAQSPTPDEARDILGVDDFTGATALADGTAGRVIQPVAGDQNKYLRADGTWSTVSSVTAPAASQSTVNAGLVDDEYVAPLTLHGYVNPQFAARAPDSGLVFPYVSGAKAMATSVNLAGPSTFFRFRGRLDSSNSSAAVSLVGDSSSATDIEAGDFQGVCWVAAIRSLRLLIYAGGIANRRRLEVTLSEDQLADNLDILGVIDRDTGTAALYLNGSPLSGSETQAGTNPPWTTTLTGGYIQTGYRNALTPFSGTILSAEYGNVALTASEVSALTRFGWAALPQYVHSAGGGLRLYTGTFAAGTDSWTVSSSYNTLAAPISIGGETDALRITLGSAATSGAQRFNLKACVPNKAGYFGLWVYVPTASVAGTVRITDNTTGNAMSGTTDVVIPRDTWTYVWFPNGTPVSSSWGIRLVSPTIGDIVYIRVPISGTAGLCGSWDFSRGAGYQQRDLSGAGNRMTLTTTGVQRLNPGDFLQVKATLAHGGSGNLQINGQALLPDLGWRLQSIVAESDASVSVYLGNVSGGSQLVASVALTANVPKDLTIVAGAAVPTTVNAWGNSDGAANITYTLTYVRTDIS